MRPHCSQSCDGLSQQAGQLTGATHPGRGRGGEQEPTSEDTNIPRCADLWTHTHTHTHTPPRA